MNTGTVVEITQLLSRYGHVADSGDLESLSEIFAPDAVFDTGPMGGAAYRGLGEIREFFGLGAPPHPPSHHVTNVYVYEDAGVVRSKSKWMAINRAADTVSTGDYGDRFVRLDDGWRIAERVATTRWGPPGTAATAGAD